MKVVKFVEPDENGEPAEIRMPVDLAIKFTQEAHPELTDEEALESFVIVNWGEIVEA